jgi:pimeloyl-ACP methyl ester carboxylesterase
MWDDTLRRLAPYYRLWALDLLGFGDSRTTDTGMTLNIDAHVQLVRDFCQQMGIQPYAVVGHSMGGSISIKLAADYPNFMERLALVCPVVTGKLHLNVGTLIGTGFAQRVMAVGEKLWPTLQTLPTTYLFVVPPYLHTDVMRRSIGDFRRSTWQAAYDGITSLAEIHLDQHLHKISVPTLVITGSQDLTVPPSDSRLAAKLIAGSTFLEYSNCHHQPPDEEPEHFNRTLLGFLDGGLSVAANAARHASQSA